MIIHASLSGTILKGWVVLDFLETSERTDILKILQPGAIQFNLLQTHSASPLSMASKSAPSPSPWLGFSITPWLMAPPEIARFQLTAFFTSAAIFSSTAGVNSFRAKATGQNAPSSRFAASLKPSVAYLVLNFWAL
jgi:hypothetical protein